MPCLDEARTLATCIRQATDAFVTGDLAGEIIVADNGSSDGSQQIAARLGARVVRVPHKGYGRALKAGIAAARGRYVIMGDADASYDFSAILPFVEKLRSGDELVVGNRFAGSIVAGAMPWLRRFVGNPVLSGLARLLFGGPVRDFHCGLRAFGRSAYDRLELSSPGMEFATEMVVRAVTLGLRISEIPIVLHRDGRGRPSHLRPWRDGWRHLVLMLRLRCRVQQPRRLVREVASAD